MTTLPNSRTILSLKTRKDILKLPGFENLGHYLVGELREFVRDRMVKYTKKTRGFTVGEYRNIYNNNPQPYKPSRPTARKNWEEVVEEAKTYDATDWSHYGGSKKERKANMIKAAKAAEKKQRRKENKAKRAAQHQANWEKHRAEKEEAKLREAEIKERMAKKKKDKIHDRIKRDIELIKGKPVKIISIEDVKK